MKRLITILAFAALSAPAFGAEQFTPSASAPPPPSAKALMPDTLMFSIDELNDIQSRAAAGASAGEKADSRGSSDAIESATLYLSTIMYSGPNDWTIWVNGKPIGPDQTLQSIKVTEIGPSYVELLVPLSAQGMRPVRLSPNQTFIAKSGAVVEGPWR